jgi:hypothetical protein
MADELVSVYEAQDLPLAELLHQRLTDAGVEAFVEPTASPLDGLTAINQGTHVYVRAVDAARARPIVEGFVAEHAD